MDFLKYYFYYVLLHLSLVGSSFVQIGDAVSINSDSSVSYLHSSNILKTQTNEKSDSIYTISPGAVLNLGRPGTELDLVLGTKYDIIKYDKNSNLDINLLKFYMNGSYRPSDLFSNTFSYSNLEGRSAKADINSPYASSLIETSSEFASIRTNYSLSPKIFFSLGFNYSDVSYNEDADKIAGRSSTTIPISLGYRYSNKLSVNCGASFTKSKIGERTYFSQEPYDTDSVYYNIGLSGSILPKLTGQFNVGYRTLSYSTATNDLNAIGASSELVWEITAKLRSSINLSQDFDISGNGATHKFTSYNLSNIYSINNDFKLVLSYDQLVKDYRFNSFILGGIFTKQERFKNISAKFYYIPSENFRFIASYNITKADAYDDYDLREYVLQARLMY